MGLRFTLIGFPIFVLLISFLLQSGMAANVPIGNVNTCISATDSSCVPPGGTQVILRNCATTSISREYLCAYSSAISPYADISFNLLSLNLQQCSYQCNAILVGGLPSTYTAGSAYPSGTNLIYAQCLQVYGGGIAFQCTTVSALSQTANNSFYNIGATIGLDANAWLALVIAIVGVGILAGVNIVGSGENPEGTHIITVGGGLLAIWLIMSALEGFFTGSPNSFFTLLNEAFTNIGSTLWVILSLVFTIGVIQTISRGV